MAILEALAHELQVISTTVEGIPNFIKHKINKLLNNAGDIDSLTEGLEQMIQNKNIRINIIKQSKLQNDTLLNPESTYKTLNDIYENFWNKTNVKYE